VTLNYSKLPQVKFSGVIYATTTNPIKEIEGDGTVLASSAQWSNTPTTTQYWVNLSAYNQSSSTDIKHTNILTAKPLQNLLTALITNASTSTLPQYITSTQPVYFNTDPRIYLILHSPLTLGFTDSSGNYTGSTATTTVFNAPDVDYERFGEVQWLSIPQSMAGQVVMRGTGSGSFALDVQSVNGNQVIGTTTFAAVPSATSTVATMNIAANQPVTQNGVLSIDFNGDGTVDRTMYAKQGNMVLPDFVPPEAVISVSTSTKDISILGVDDVSPATTVTKTATTTTITDQSGNTTTLYFSKTFTNNLLTYARLTGINYGTSTMTFTSSFLYVWDVSNTLVSQTVVADNTFAIEALYNKTTNKTTIIVLKKNVPVQTTVVNGLAIIKLATNKGNISYSW